MAKTRKLGMLPAFMVLVAVIGLAFLVGIIYVMMVVRTGIRHSPGQSWLQRSRPMPTKLKVADPKVRIYGVTV